MSKAITDRDAEADMAVCDAATRGPWHVVGNPWLPSGCSAYIVAGNPDPHIGKAVLDGVEIMEWPAEDDGPDYSQVDADLAFAAMARTALPVWISRAVAAEARAANVEALLAWNAYQISLEQFRQLTGGSAPMAMIAETLESVREKLKGTGG